MAFDPSGSFSSRQSSLPYFLGCVLFFAFLSFLHLSIDCMKLFNAVDELELIRIPSSQEVVLRFAQHITDSSINLATGELPTPSTKREICNVCLDIQPPEVSFITLHFILLSIKFYQFMSDVRKIMVTLIEYSLRKMSTLPNARSIFDVVRRKLICENFFVTSGIMQQYAYTGASERRIRFAVNASL